MNKKFLTGLLLSSQVIANEPVEEIVIVPTNLVCGVSELLFGYTDHSEESLVWSKVETNGNIISLWESEKNDTFTLIKTEPSGAESCILAMYKNEDTIL